jgi:hypothetical protein
MAAKKNDGCNGSVKHNMMNTSEPQVEASRFTYTNTAEVKVNARISIAP